MGRVSLRVFEWPDECPGAHDLYPHAHGARADICSGRYWCRSCWRWFGGEACERGRIIPSVLVAA